MLHLSTRQCTAAHHSCPCLTKPPPPALQIADVHHSQAELASLTSELALQRAAIASACKLHVELDRCEAAREAGYHVALAKVLHSGQQAKSDLLLGLPASWPSLELVRGALRLSCM